MSHIVETDEKTPPMDEASDDIQPSDDLGDKKQLPPLSLSEGDDHFHDDDADHPSVVTHQDIFDRKIQVISNVVFVIASAIYVAMEVTILPYYQFYKNVPIQIRESNDDEIWWQYYNETDAFPDYLYNATDDYTWEEWYNSSFLDEAEELNEFVFQVPKADSKYENADEEYAAWVSQYMVLYFCAALGFLVTGILEFSISRRFWTKMLYAVMILAAIFGIVSSMFVNKDPYVAIVLNAVSVHLFALEAISIIISRFRSLKRMEMEAMSKSHQKSMEGKEFPSLDWIEFDTTCPCLPLMAWNTLGDISFFIGTSGDVVLSYFYIFQEEYVEQAVAAAVSAVFWLLSALLYLGVSSIEMRRTKMQFKEAGLREKPEDFRKIQLILLALVVLAIAMLVLGLVFGLDTSDDESVFLEEGTVAPTDSDTDTSTDSSTGTQSPMGECNMTMSTFSQSTMVLTFAVMSSITPIETRYAANVFAKTYQALIHNELDELPSKYCDPYCRQISDVSVVETNTVNIFETSQRQASGCDTELKLTFLVEGTYWGCKGSPFPGLFSDATDSDAEALNMTGMILKQKASCQVCPEATLGEGLPAPTTDDLLESMQPYMAALPTICELQSAEVLDDGKRL